MMKRLTPTAALLMGLSILMLRPAYPESIPLKLEGGTYVVPVLINGTVTLNFTVDSGAAEVQIPADVVGTLRRTGTISEADLLEPSKYVLADGSVRKQPRFRIRTLKVGDFELRNVVASVSSMRGNLLLGQSFLSQVQSWSVDNQRHVLVLNEDVASHSHPVERSVTRLPSQPGAARTPTSPLGIHTSPAPPGCSGSELASKVDRLDQIMRRLTRETADASHTGSMPVCYVLVRTTDSRIDGSEIRELIDEKTSLESQLQSCTKSDPVPETVTPQDSHLAHLASYIRECNDMSDSYLHFIAGLYSNGLMGRDRHEELRSEVRSLMAQQQNIADGFEGVAETDLTTTMKYQTLMKQQPSLAAMFSLAFIYAQKDSKRFDQNRAIDLWARAADVALANGDRETALKALSHIEYLDKTHPAAERLRRTLFR